MSITLAYQGNGSFRAIYPDKCADLEPGTVAAWSKVEYRSRKTHDHYFAVIHEVWVNLPESLVDEFPNAEVLRKYALIKAGYCDIDKIVCANNQEAMNLVTATRRRDAYAVINLDGRVVTIYTAHSQSVAAMGRKVFQESKDAVLDMIGRLIGSTVKENMERAA